MLRTWTLAARYLIHIMMCDHLNPINISCCTEIKFSLQPSLVIIRLRCVSNHQTKICEYCPPRQLPFSQTSAAWPQLSSSPTESHSNSFPQIPKLGTCSLLVHSPSSFHISGICVTSCRKPSTTPHLNRVVAFLPCSHGPVQLILLAQLLLCCSTRTCFPVYITGFMKMAVPFLGGCICRIYHKHPGNILYNN